MESLYEESPCGSFVLWKPKDQEGDPWRNGVPLCADSRHPDPVWLVDGQQRTRALLDTFRQLAASTNEPDDRFLVREADHAALQASGPALYQSRNTAASDLKDDEQEANKDQDQEKHPLLWMVVLPAMSEFDRRSKPYFGRHSESRNVQRGALFRHLSPRVRTRLNAAGKNRRNPPLPVGMVPLAALLFPSSVFVDSGLRQAGKSALDTFYSPDVDLASLDDLFPWGPQFVTGYALELAQAGSVRPMRWADLTEHREETNIREMTDCLTGLFSPQWSDVFDRFERMFSGDRFAAGWLPTGHVGHAINAYVRINRAGIRVRADERALALLSRAKPAILDDLATYMTAKDDRDEVGSQRDLLVHESGKQMGFSRWIGTVTRYVALALLGKSARRWLGVSAIEKNTFSYWLDRVGPDETPAGKSTWARQDFADAEEILSESAARATATLLLIDSVLSEELRFDHRMARPSIDALQPLVDLFYRIPEVELRNLRTDVAFRSAIARILHWTLLAPYIDKSEIERLVDMVHGLDEANQNDQNGPLAQWNGAKDDLHERLRRALCRYRNGLLACSQRKRQADSSTDTQKPSSYDEGTVSEQLTELALANFRTEVWNSRSLRHPAVGWLYVLERRGLAREFDWQIQINAYIKSEGKQGVPKRPELGSLDPLLLQSKTDFASPEKQHIVPFSYAKQIVDKGGTRSTSSPANAIGNLTWLSNRQNALDALSDRWAVMDRDCDADNLTARGMLAMTEFEGEPRDVIGLYEELTTLVLFEAGDWRTNRARAQQLLEAFCNGRVEWMVKEMEQWLSEPLDPEAQWWLDDQIDPTDLPPVEINHNASDGEDRKTIVPRVIGQTGEAQ